MTAALVHRLALVEPDDRGGGRIVVTTSCGQSGAPSVNVDKEPGLVTTEYPQFVTCDGCRP